MLRSLAGAGNLGLEPSDLSGHLVCSCLSHLARGLDECGYYMLLLLEVQEPLDGIGWYGVCLNMPRKFPFQRGLRQRFEAVPTRNLNLGALGAPEAGQQMFHHRISGSLEACTKCSQWQEGLGFFQRMQAKGILAMCKSSLARRTCSFAYLRRKLSDSKYHVPSISLCQDSAEVFCQIFLR